MDIKDFADILFLKFTLEKNLELKQQLLKKKRTLSNISKQISYLFF
jgi:hypothetical protein